jgi:hypothetical protein
VATPVMVDRCALLALAGIFERVQGRARWRPRRRLESRPRCARRFIILNIWAMPWFSLLSPLNRSSRCTFRYAGLAERMQVSWIR